MRGKRDGTSATPILDVGAASDVGKSRERNEDAYYAGTTIFGVADGLGGHRAGEVASRIAVDELALLDQERYGDPVESLAGTVRSINEMVRDRSRSDPETSGMSTTITVIAIDATRAYLAHVGDSRLYLLRRGTLTQISKDHTLVARMVEDGAITQEQADHHPQRSIVTRAIGADGDVEIDTATLDLQGGDRLLLCSDGLCGVVPEPDMARIAGEARPIDQVCARLVDDANARGGPDNITVVIVEIDPALGGDGAPPLVETRTLSSPVVSAPLREPETGPMRRPAPKRMFPVRTIVWLVILVALAVGGMTGVRIWANSSWYVGFDGEKVAIYQGLPTDFIISLHHVKETTALTKLDLAPFYRERLTQGIRASSLEDARRIVSNAPRATPLPSPAATRTPPRVFLPRPSPSVSHS